MQFYIKRPFSTMDIHRNSVGTEFHANGWVKIIDEFHQPDAANLE